MHGQAPTVVSVDMGYGHLRAAAPLADALGTQILHADRPPLADSHERKHWARARRLYEVASRVSQLPVVGPAVDALLSAVTSIPRLHPARDLSAPTWGARSLHRLIESGLGRGLVEQLRANGSGLLTTFYAPAIAAEHFGCKDVTCVVTDSDLNRVWAPIRAAQSHIKYFVPSRRAQRRLAAYGVPLRNIECTGFPLPDELVGGPDLSTLRRNLRGRLVRLDPQGAFREMYKEELSHFLGPLPKREAHRPPLLVFAIGGTGAQVGIAPRLLPSFRTRILEERIRLTLVAGVRGDVASKFHRLIDDAGLGGRIGSGIEVLYEADFDSYYRRFNQLLADSDILWTKPSELTFYAALGIPLVLSSPVGVHEFSNRRWARESGAGLKQRDARYAAGWIDEWLTDGILAAAAWSGYRRLPKLGLYRILHHFGAEFSVGDTLANLPRAEPSS
ncbi:MAG TPA: hypothetical protein VFV14_07620 [Myxococcaceae bacterium]|nr:hypothetical protein [Myxococcaceae bacterium]